MGPSLFYRQFDTTHNTNIPAARSNMGCVAIHVGSGVSAGALRDAARPRA